MRWSSLPPRSFLLPPSATPPARGTVSPPSRSQRVRERIGWWLWRAWRAVVGGGDRW